MPKIFDPRIGESTRWQKGRSGNPGGRPRTKALTEAYRAVLGIRCPIDPDHRTFAQLIAWRLATAAAGGDLKAAIELADRTEGRVRDAVVPLDGEAQQRTEDLSNLSIEELEQIVLASQRSLEEITAEQLQILSDCKNCGKCAGSA
jgi:hypothetical protein